jgi:tetratricopeptide (TPR) repeat protein
MMHMASRSNFLGLSLKHLLAGFAAWALVTVVYGQPLQNPYENPFDTPPPKPAQPAPATAEPDQLPADLRGPRTPGRVVPSRPRTTTEPSTSPDTTRDSMDEDPFADDAVQPDDATTKPSPSTKPAPRATRQPPRDSTVMPDASDATETVDPALIARINELLAAEKFEEVIPLLESVVTRIPPDIVDVNQLAQVANIWIELGRAYRMTGRYRQSVKALGEAAAYAPYPDQLTEAHLRRGIAWFYMGEPRIAVAEFEQALSASIRDPRPELWKGLSYAKLERYREAILAYSNSLRIYSGYTLARSNRGLAYLAIGELDLAVADFDEVIRQTPDDASAYYKRAIALARRGDLREAVSSYDDAIRLDAKFAPSYYNRGMLHRRLGNAQQAESDLAKARQLNPQVESLPRPPRLAQR